MSILLDSIYWLAYQWQSILYSQRSIIVSISWLMQTLYSNITVSFFISLDFRCLFSVLLSFLTRVLDSVITVKRLQKSSSTFSFIYKKKFISCIIRIVYKSVSIMISSLLNMRGISQNLYIYHRCRVIVLIAVKY